MGPPAEPTEYPGRRFALPRSGPESVASNGIRVGAFLIDLAIAFGVAWLFTRPDLPRNLSLYIWAPMTAIAVGLVGSTPGHVILGLRVAPVGGPTFVGLWAVPRTVLTFLVIPPLLTDADNRGLHDRLCRTIVVRTR